MLRVMLVDDEPPARRSLRHLLSAHEDVQVVAEAASVDEALAMLDNVAAQVLFLDVELTDGQGFDLLRAIGLDPNLQLPHVVMVTAYSRYATAAFDVEAMDFLLKPVEPERLARTLDRLRRRIMPGVQPSGAAADMPASGRLLVNTAGRSLHLSLDSITSVLAEGDYSRITMANGQSHLVCRLLGQFATELPAPPFFRLSRSVIVNVARIEQVVWQEGERAMLYFADAPQPLALGRAGTRRLRQMWRAGP